MLPNTDGGKDTTQRANAGNLILSWRTVAFASILIAISTLGTLIIVTATTNTDALSTIALALAIIAFVIQIMVFVAQIFASNQQVARNEEIYAQLHGLLEGLRGTTQGTQETLNNHFRLLIQAATTSASDSVEEGANGEVFNPEEFQERMLEEIARVVDQRAPQSSLEQAFSLPQPSRPGGYPDFFSRSDRESLSAEDQAIVEQLRTFPEEEEGRAAYELLQSLSPLSVNWLRKYADNELRRRQEGRTGNMRSSPEAPASSELERKGLVQRESEADDREALQTTLTPLGRQTARLLTARGKNPAWLRELIIESTAGNA